jgi:hypothetical protein
VDSAEIAQLSREVSRLARQTLIRHALGDYQGAADGLSALAQRGSFALFAATWAWAASVSPVDGIDGDYIASLKVVNLDTGETLDPQTMPGCLAPALWAGRMVTAVANRDPETAWALFRAEVDNAPNADALVTLLSLAAAALLTPEPDPSTPN